MAKKKTKAAAALEPKPFHPTRAMKAEAAELRRIAAAIEEGMFPTTASLRKEGIGLDDRWFLLSEEEWAGNAGTPPARNGAA